MPPKKIKIVCTDKVPLPQGTIRQRPGFCFKQGLRAGFAAGIQKGTKQARERVAQQAQERENTLMAANDVNIQAPRVKPAGRKQKFRNFYGLDRVADVVAQNPIAALPAPIVNIWDRVNRMGGKAQRGEEPTGGVRNRDELIAELVKNEPDLPDRTQGISTLKKLGKRVLINLLVGTGKYERGRENMGSK